MREPRPYILVRTRRRKRTVSLHVERDGRLVIYCPVNTPNRVIEEFFESKRRWAERKLAEQARSVYKPKEFAPGETFLFLGRECALEFCGNGGGKGRLRFEDGRFLLASEGGEEARALFTGWYRERAAVIIGERVCHLAGKTGLLPEAVKITGAERRWGSCSRKNTLCFAWRLVMAPLPVIDYVVLHEICHIRHKDHSPLFWGLMEGYLPEYKRFRDWLKKYGYLLDL